MKKLLICFVMGLLIGTIAANLMQLGSLWSSIDYQGAVSYINQWELFWFILGRRGIHFFIVWLLSFTIFCWPVLYGYCLYYGFTTGAMISILTMDLGLKSIIVYSSLQFPQIIIYLPLWVLFAFQCIRQGRQFRQADVYGRKKSYRPLLLRWTGIFCGMMFVLAIGVFFEAFVNPWVIQNIFRMI